MANDKWPVYGEITGPVVMIGFGSIGRGTLPLIERHFKFDKSRMVVIDPQRRQPQAARRARHRLRAGSRHQGQLQGTADAAADQGRRPGLLRQPVGRHRFGRPDAALPQARRALRRHRHRAVARLLLRQQGRTMPSAPTTRCARRCLPRSASIRAARPPFPPAAPIRAWSRGSSSRRWSTSPPISASKFEEPGAARPRRLGAS